MENWNYILAYLYFWASKYFEGYVNTLGWAKQDLWGTGAES